MKTYEILKKIMLGIVPKSFVFKHELKIRSFIYPFYKGNKFECNICESKLKSFTNNFNKTCPKCSSIFRERRLWGVLNQNSLLDKQTILDFSPSRSLYRELKKMKGDNYVTSDLSDNFLADKKYDLTQIECKDESFDLVICYHILEHIENDIQAIKELFRILKNDGKCLVQTPFKEGDIYEDYSIQTKEARKKAFLQEDHVRIYSVEGLKSRLESVGFKVEILNFKEEKDTYHGFRSPENILICEK